MENVEANQKQVKASVGTSAIADVAGIIIMIVIVIVVVANVVDSQSLDNTTAMGKVLEDFTTTLGGVFGLAGVLPLLSIAAAVFVYMRYFA